MGAVKVIIAVGVLVAALSVLFCASALISGAVIARQADKPQKLFLTGVSSVFLLVVGMVVLVVLGVVFYTTVAVVSYEPKPSFYIYTQYLKRKWEK